MGLSSRIWKFSFLIARLFLGLAFLFSGFVKAVDPLGTAYKIDDYLHAFGWTYFSGISLIASIGLSAFEFFLGASLFLGIYKRTTSLFALVFMLILTPFTLYIVVANPVTDCGCFGDALHLSNGATFAKNLFLLIFALITYLRHNDSYNLFGPHSTFWVGVWCLLFPLLVSTYSYLHLPLLDFRPYQIGNHLPELMNVPEGESKDSVEVEFVYRKDGKTSVFSLDEAPLNDTSWTFVDRTERIIHLGKQPLIHDFELRHPILGNITDEVLQDTSYVFLMVSPKLEDMNYKFVPDFLKVKKEADRYGYRFLLLTSSPKSVVDDWKYEFDENMTVLSVDETTLKTIIRSNPGLMLLKGGTVFQKWSCRDIPDFDAVDKPLNKTAFGHVAERTKPGVVGGLLLFFFLPLSVLWMLHHGYRLSFTWQKKKSAAKKEEL
jgi:hypothetical protein